MKGLQAMTNVKTPIDSFQVKDLEDGSSLSVHVESCTELGNAGLPGIQIHYLGGIICLEPSRVERYAYEARKAGSTEWFLADQSWTVHADQFIRTTVVFGGPRPKARVEVKTRSRSKPLVKEYELPFALEEE